MSNVIRTTIREKVNYSPPYTFIEIYNFEKDAGISLPLQLKIYLLEISKDIYDIDNDFLTIIVKSN